MKNQREALEFAVWTRTTAIFVVKSQRHVDFGDLRRVFNSSSENIEDYSLNPFSIASLERICTHFQYWKSAFCLSDSFFLSVALLWQKYSFNNLSSE